MDKKIITLLLFLFFAGSAMAWYNDVGNDTCLTVFSNTGVYYPSLIDPLIRPLLKVQNDCGVGIVANLGIFFQSKDVEQLQLSNIEQAFSRSVHKIGRASCRERV